MKWIKTAIGAVIAISVLPLVVLSVINIKKSLDTEKITMKITITFEMDYLYDFLGGLYIFEHTLRYDELIDYLEKGYTITNLYDYTNDITITITDWYFNNHNNLEMVDNNSVVYIFILDDNVQLTITSSYDSIYNTNAPDIALMDIILTKTSIKNVNLVATLISFVPIIFVGGVVLYFYKRSKKN